MLGRSRDGDDHVQTALSVLDWSPDIMTDLSGKLSQINLHTTHSVIFSANIVIEQRDINEVVQLLIPVEIKGLPPLGVESVVQDLGLDFLLAECYLMRLVIPRLYFV